MSLVRVLILGIVLLAVAVFAAAQNVGVRSTATQSSKAESELRKFFDSYGEDLRRHDREAIADRYDRRGVYLMGNGKRSLMTFEAIRNRYLKDWKGPKHFEWKDVSIEMTSKNSAVVTALFEWGSGSSEAAKCSYTGVFLKRSGKWRIRVEDESCAR